MSFTEWILRVRMSKKRKENSIAISPIGLHRSWHRSTAIFSTGYGYTLELSSSLGYYLSKWRGRGKGQTTGSSVDGYEDRNRGSNTGVALERSWGWPGNSTYFSLFGLSVRGWEAGRGKLNGDKERKRTRGGSRGRNGKENGGKPRSRKHFST